MMENTNNNMYSQSDPAILSLLGSFIQHTRLQQNKTQQQLADLSGLNRSTIVQIENGGGGTLLSFIQLLRALESLHVFRNFEVQQQFSPLQLAKLEHKKRKRARAKKTNGMDKPKSLW